MRAHAEPITPPARHKRPANPQEAAGATEAAANPNPEVSAIGELSSGDAAEFRRQTEESIAEIERGLNGINRNLNDSEQKTADHIREFLKQAKAALASGDVDGAHTLAAKAKVLLDELTK
jgi:spore germination protein YaaH